MELGAGWLRFVAFATPASLPFSCLVTPQYDWDRAFQGKELFINKVDGPLRFFPDI